MDWVLAVLVIILIVALAVTLVRENGRYERVLRRQVMLVRATRSLALFVEAQAGPGRELPPEVRVLIDKGWDAGDSADTWPRRCSWE